MNSWNEGITNAIAYIEEFATKRIKNNVKSITFHDTYTRNHHLSIFVML